MFACVQMVWLLGKVAEGQGVAMLHRALMGQGVQRAGGSTGLPSLPCGPLVIPRQINLLLDPDRVLSLSRTHTRLGHPSLSLCAPPSVWDTRIPGGAQPSAHPRKSASSPFTGWAGSHAATPLTASRLLSPVLAESLARPVRPKLNGPLPKRASPVPGASRPKATPDLS
jgi:hypothetical protein